jgi:hypothetical protein
VSQGAETVDSFAGQNDHAAPVAPVASVGAAPGHVLLASKADAAVSSVAGLDLNFDFVDEHLGGMEKR